MQSFKPPEDFDETVGLRIFLAGSIEMGAAEDWQARVTARLGDLPNLVVLNPRRDDWDASWEQSIDDPRFRKQVEWELAGLEAADLVAMNLLPETRAPISLLELGLTVRRRDLIVCCPSGYWRCGNVQVVLARYGGELHDDEESWLQAVYRWAEDRVGEPLLRPPPESRELGEREGAVERDPCPENLVALWTLYRRLGLVETEEFAIEVPEAVGWGSGDWRANGFLGRRTLATLGEAVGEPGPHLEFGLLPVGGEEGTPEPDRQFYVERRVLFDVRKLLARFTSEARIDQDVVWQGAMRVEPSRELLATLGESQHQAEVPLRVALADMRGWVRMETRRGLARAVAAIRRGLRGA